MSAFKEKLILMGLAQSGKSSIADVIFAGKKLKSVMEYEATIGYRRETREFIGNEIQIYDTGGQTSYINELLGKEAQYIFSNVRSLIWIVDSAVADQLSNSRFYFSLAVQKLSEYSPEARLNVLFHKADLLKDERRKTVFENLKEYFTPPVPIDVSYYQTSIFEQNIFDAFGHILQDYVGSSDTLMNVQKLLKMLVETDSIYQRIGIYTLEGVPVTEAGDKTNKSQVTPLRNWLNTIVSLQKENGISEHLEGIIKIADEKFMIFKSLKMKILLTMIIKDIHSLDEIASIRDFLAERLNSIL